MLAAIPELLACFGEGGNVWLSFWSSAKYGSVASVGRVSVAVYTSYPGYDSDSSSSINGDGAYQSASLADVFSSSPIGWADTFDGLSNHSP